MFNNGALDVVIGLVFIYLLYSLLVTIIQEIIANKFSYRAKFLQKSIMRMLDDKAEDEEMPFFEKYGIIIKKSKPKINSFSYFFYKHPLIKYLGEKPNNSRPSYIMGGTFAKVVLDLLRGNNIKPGEETRTKIQDSLNTGIVKWNNPSFGEEGNKAEIKNIETETLSYLNSIWADAQGDVEKYKVLLEDWFNETMNRTTGWYKKYTQFICFFIGLIIAVVFNVDTIAIAIKLQKDPTLRAQIIQQADAYIKAHPNLIEEQKKEQEEIITETNKTIDSSNPKKDSLLTQILIKVKDSLDEKYEQIKKKGDSLTKEANDLVRKDIASTNQLLGIGIDSYKIPNSVDNKIGFVLMSILGWFITALALSLGAPFWYDLLNKLMKLRSSIAPKEDATTKPTDSLKKIERVG